MKLLQYPWTYIWKKKTFTRKRINKSIYTVPASHVLPKTTVETIDIRNCKYDSICRVRARKVWFHVGSVHRKRNCAVVPPRRVVVLPKKYWWACRRQLGTQHVQRRCGRKWWSWSMLHDFYDEKKWLSLPIDATIVYFFTRIAFCVCNKLNVWSRCCPRASRRKCQPSRIEVGE